MPQIPKETLYVTHQDPGMWKIHQKKKKKTTEAILKYVCVFHVYPSKNFNVPSCKAMKACEL